MNMNENHPVMADVSVPREIVDARIALFRLFDNVLTMPNIRIELWTHDHQQAFAAFSDWRREHCLIDHVDNYEGTDDVPAFTVYSVRISNGSVLSLFSKVS